MQTDINQIFVALFQFLGMCNSEMSQSPATPRMTFIETAKLRRTQVMTNQSAGHKSTFMRLFHTSLMLPVQDLINCSELSEDV